MISSKNTDATPGVNSDEVSRGWLAANDALLTAARPSWADAERVVLDYHYGEVDAVGFVREICDVAVEQWFALEDGALRALQNPEIRILAVTADNGVFTPEEAASISVSMMAAALVFGSDATVSELRAAAVDAGLSTGDVYAAMGGNL